MLFTVPSGLVASLFMIPFGKFIKSKWSFIVVLPPLCLLLYYASYISTISSGGQIKSWNPRFGYLPCRLIYTLKAAFVSKIKVNAAAAALLKFYLR